MTFCVTMALITAIFLDDSEDFVDTRLMLDWKVTSATIDYIGRVYYYDLPLWEKRADE